MTIDELLNQQSNSRKDSPCGLTLETIIHYGGFDIGVTNQEEKDMLEGYLLVTNSKTEVFIHEFYCHSVNDAVAIE